MASSRKRAGPSTKLHGLWFKLAESVTRRVSRQMTLDSLAARLLLADARSRDATAGRVSSAKRIWRARRV